MSGFLLSKEKAREILAGLPKLPEHFVCSADAKANEELKEALKKARGERDD